MVMARSLHGYTRRLEAKVQKLEETMKARRDVDKAVRILVSLKKIGETEAYELIRSQGLEPDAARVESRLDDLVGRRLLRYVDLGQPIREQDVEPTELHEVPRRSHAS